MAQSGKFGGKKPVLDKDLKKIGRLEKATLMAGRESARVGLAVIFLVGVAVAATVGGVLSSGGIAVIAAAIIGAYMALNIGANDVANNMGPAVGARALTMAGALIVAAVFETAGAIIAGGDVVATVSKGIIDPAMVGDPAIFLWAMMAALLAAALWVNIATYVGAPVSTTHAIVGGVLGSALVAAEFSAVNWPIMGKIVASWIISPLLGGLIAALFLWLIKVLVIYRADRIAAARRWVPIFVAIMAAAFAAYLTVKGLKRIWKPDTTMLLAITGGAFIVAWGGVHLAVGRAARHLDNSRKALKGLFIIPLICSAALLSFAHGANDVANAVGPLAAIVSVAGSGVVAAKASVPLWVMMIGGLGISLGLMLFGPRLIRTVGEQITRLDSIRAYAVALSAAITVIVASALGLPVSSTHIAIGGIFGVGFLREYLAANGARKKQGRKAAKRRLVRRRHLYQIIAAWLVTVPSAAAMSALIFVVLRMLFVP